MGSSEIKLKAVSEKKPHINGYSKTLKVVLEDSLKTSIIREQKSVKIFVELSNQLLNLFDTYHYF